MEIEIVTFITGIINYFLAIFVYFKNKKNPVNRSFSAFSAFVGIWSLSLYFYSQPIIFSPLVWIKIVYFVAAFPMSFSYIHLSYVFPEGRKRIPVKYYLALGLTSIPLIYLLFFTDLWVKDIVVVRPWGYETVLGSGYGVLGIYSFFLIVWIMHNLTKKYLSVTNNEIVKTQIKYMFLGMFLFATIAVFFDVAIPILFNTSRFFALSPVSSIFLVGFTALAITKYHLFGIRIILTELLVVVMGIILLILPFMMPTGFLKILTFIIFFLFCFFGYLLIKTTHQEIKRREKLENLAKHLQNTTKDLHKAYKKIKSLSEMKAEFLKVANHQLRGPVTVIKGMLSMVLDGFIRGKEVDEFMKKAYISAERLTSILDDILLCQNLIGEVWKINLLQCQIEEILAKQTAHFNFLAKAKNLKLILEKPKEPIPISFLDSRTIEKIISRLIENAVLYTKKGEIRLSVNLIRKRDKKIIQVLIKDTGIGFNKEDRKGLFKLFHRGRRAASLHPNGSGLGLFIVKSLLKSHDGKIEVESKGIGMGSKFIITLPFITEL